MTRRMALGCLLLVAMLCIGARAAAADEPAYPSWQPPVPKDGFDRPAPGVLAMPAEFSAWGGTLRRHPQVEPDTVHFLYTPASEGAGAHPRSRISVYCFLQGRKAHAMLADTLRAANMSRTPWTKTYERIDHPDLVYRSKMRDRLDVVVGVVRHSYFRIDCPLPKDAPADHARLVRETGDATRELVRIIEGAGSALSDAPRSIASVVLRRVPHPSPTGPDTGEFHLAVFPGARAEQGVQTVTLLLAWRRVGAGAPWNAHLTHASWTSGAQTTDTRSPVIAYFDKAVDDAALEFRLLRPHDGDGPFKLEEIRFSMGTHKRTTSWKRVP